MEIERKFLIQEKDEDYFCPFPIKKLKREITSKGNKVIQYYLPRKLLSRIQKEFEFEINYKPSQIGIRQTNKKYFLTIKSYGNLEREEFEIEILKKQFKFYSKFAKKVLKKKKLLKKYKNNRLEFDFFSKRKLITCEIEFKTKKEAKQFKTKMKEITTNERYKNKKMAKKIK